MASAALLSRQLKQMQSDRDIPGISCGLVDDNNIFEWEVMLMISDDVKYYGGEWEGQERGARGIGSLPVHPSWDGCRRGAVGYHKSPSPVTRFMCRAVHRPGSRTDQKRAASAVLLAVLDRRFLSCATQLPEGVSTFTTQDEV